MERSLRVLRMVRHLHQVGYERLRVCPGVAATGIWRCFITPAGNMFQNGWLPLGLDGTEVFVADAGPYFFGWADSVDDDGRSLALKYLFRSTHQLQAAQGRDPAYVRWFAERLRNAEKGRLPALFCRGRLDVVGEESLPPPLPTDVEPFCHDFQRVATSDISLADLPAATASDERVVAFALSMDGYLWAEATGRNLQDLAEAVKKGGYEGRSLEELRATAFHWQRCEKWSSTMEEAQLYIARVRSTIEAIRRVLNGVSCEAAVDERSNRAQ